MRLATPSPSVDCLTEASRAISLLFRPEDVIEVRVPKAGRQRTISGYFDDPLELQRAVVRLEESEWPGVYWTLNPVNPALLARASNKLKSFAETTTSDADILCRRWLPIDLDPRRPAGISSSDEEHEAALDLVVGIREKLGTEGWPVPILADSGNGAHLLYRIELPNDPAATVLVKACLQALAARFSTEGVAIDVALFNASRIFKAYGTTSRKGDNTEERPHRRSHIIEAPSRAAVTPIALLEEVAKRASAGNSDGAKVFTMPGQGQFDVEQFLRRHGIGYKAAVAYKGGRKFVLEQCPFDPSHRAPDSAVFEQSDGRLGFRCLHNSCHGRGWRQFRELFEPGYERKAIGREAGEEPSEDERHDPAPAASWPAPIGEEAYYGIAGRFIRLVEPHTEADSSFMLVQFLAYAGNIFGRRAFVWAGGDKRELSAGLRDCTHP
jgi:hypothetical protein